MILRPNGHWDSPGQNCIIEDARGNEWIIYHAVDVKERFLQGTDRFLRKMCMDPVLYTDEGWPYIENASPSFEPRQGPSVVIGPHLPGEP